jgi:hypothetical protein
MILGQLERQTVSDTLLVLEHEIIVVFSIAKNKCSKHGYSLSASSSHPWNEHYDRQIDLSFHYRCVDEKDKSLALALINIAISIGSKYYILLLPSLYMTESCIASVLA